MNNIYYLSHGGPGSGRYPLGSGNRPYQKYEGFFGRIRAKKAAEEEQKKLIEEEKKKQDKERVLREGTATEVLKYQGELSKQELQDVVQRLNLENQIRNLSSKESQATVDKIDNIMKTVKSSTEWTKTGIEAYNTLASIYNSTPSEGKKNPLPFIGTNGKK